MKTYQQQLAVYGREIPKSKSFKIGSRAYKSKCKAILDVAEAHLLFIQEKTCAIREEILAYFQLINHNDLVKFVKLYSRLPSQEETVQIRMNTTFELWFDKYYVQPDIDEESVFWMGSDAYILFHSL